MSDLPGRVHPRWCRLIYSPDFVWGFVAGANLMMILVLGVLR